MFASATPTRVYLLIEHRAEWGNKALEESNLPQAVKERLKGFTRDNPQAKTMLIRRAEGGRQHASGETVAADGEHSGRGITFFAAQTDEPDPRLYRFELESYQDVLELELEAFLAQGQRYAAQRSQLQLALVCTNGRRDACCNKFGRPVFASLSQAAGEQHWLQAWQSTHLGGHRFAANLLWLPTGVLYGRLDPHSALEILAAHQQAQIFLPNLRGRSAYPEPAQAAEFFLRQRTAEYNLDAFHLLGVRETGENRWQIEFSSQRSGELQRVDVSREVEDSTVYESCTLDKSTRITRYRLVE